MKLVHEGHELSRVEIAKIHRKSILDIVSLIKEAKRDQIVIDGYVYKFKHEEVREKPPESAPKKNMEYSNMKVLELINGFPSGIKKEYEYNGHLFPIATLAKIMDISYSTARLRLENVKSFKTRGKVYTLKDPRKMYDLYHETLEDILKIPLKDACEVAMISPPSVEKYIENSWYGRSGYRIRESKC